MPEARAAGAALPHLAGPSAGLRQAMAAHFLADWPHVVEIGGAGAPLTGHLRTVPRSVTVIDPKIEPLMEETLRGEPCRVRHIRAKVQAIADAEPPAPFALAMLGLSLKPWGEGALVTPALARLIGRAGLLVIDHALDLVRAGEQLPALLSLTRLPTMVTMDYALDDGVIGEAGFARRRLVVLGERFPSARLDGN
jgi:hypothetical protein